MFYSDKTVTCWNVYTLNAILYGMSGETMRWKPNLAGSLVKLFIVSNIYKFAFHVFLLDMSQAIKTENILLFNSVNIGALHS